MAEEPANETRGRFLPPEPAGPEPDLGAAPPPGAGEPPGGEQLPPQQQGWHPPADSQPQQAPPGWQQQPPPQGWQPPAAHQPWQQQGSQWGWQAPPKEPDNGSAVAGFVLALTAIGLLVISGGLSSILSAACASFAIFYSLKGRRRVDRGETPKHRGLAQAGFIIGIVSLVLALMATVVWVLVLTSDGFWDDLERELEENDGGGEGFETSLRVAAQLAGAIARSM